MSAFRRHSSSWGRYTQSDPISLDSDWHVYAYAYDNPLMYFDLIGLKPGEPYASRDAAATAALSDICALSRREHREYGGYIYRRPDRTFSYTPPKRGGRRSMKPPDRSTIPRGGDMSGFYHTHGDDTMHVNDDEFSVHDRRSAHKFGQPTYLGTPQGRVKRFNPYPPPTRWWQGNDYEGYESDIGSCPCQP